MSEFTVVDLCAGTGIFSYAFEQKGYKCVFANDIEKASEIIYKNNNNDKVFKLGDLHNIETTDIPKHDILTTGIPCQSWSIAGKRLGFEDKRSNIFWKTIEIIKFRKPKIVIIENVKNLLSHDGGNTFEIIFSKLEECGYYINSQVLDTQKLTGIPQHRERIYIVCFRSKKMFRKFEFDFKEVDSKHVKDFLEQNVPEKYYYTNRMKIYNTVVRDVKDDVNDDAVYQYRRTYVRKNKSGCCPTLTHNMGTAGHNVPLIKVGDRIRKLTPRECFNLQGFPSDYNLSGLSDAKLYGLAGNAVSYPVIKLLIDKIDECMKS